MVSTIGMVADVFWAALPWIVAGLVAIAATAVVLFWWWRTNPVKAFRSSKSGDELLIVADKDGVGTIKDVDYYAGDSTLNVDRFDPFLIPEHEGPSAAPACNIGGRVVHWAYRGLGIVQSVEGAIVAMAAKSVGIKDGEEMRQIMEGELIPWEELGEEARARVDTIPKNPGEAWVVRFGDKYLGPFGGVVLDFRAAANYAPFSVKPDWAGAIRAEEAKLAARNEGWSAWQKFVVLCLLILTALVLGSIVLHSVFGGGSGGSPGGAQVGALMLAGRPWRWRR